MVQWTGGCWEPKPAGVMQVARPGHDWDPQKPDTRGRKKMKGVAIFWKCCHLVSTLEISKQPIWLPTLVLLLRSSAWEPNNGCIVHNKEGVTWIAWGGPLEHQWLSSSPMLLCGLSLCCGYLRGSHHCKIGTHLDRTTAMCTVHWMQQTIGSLVCLGKWTCWELTNSQTEKVNCEVCSREEAKGVEVFWPERSVLVLIILFSLCRNRLFRSACLHCRHSVLH